jgi:DNA-binding CsgD family transcriptional regulator
VPTSDQYVQLLEELIGAPGSVDRWQAFLNRLCDAFDGSAASFISIQSRSQDSQIMVTARTDPAALAAYQEHWHQFDPWARGITQTRPAAGAVLLGEEFIRADEMKRTPFYNDFGHDYGITRSLAGMIEASSQQFSCLSINRGDDAKPFHQHDVTVLNALMPHLQRALQVHRRLSRAESVSEGLAEVVNHTDHGVVLLSANGRVKFVNSVADRMLAARDGLLLDCGELRTTSETSTRELRKAIYAATTMNVSSRACPPLLIGRHLADCRPLIVVVTPIRGPVGIFGDESIAVAVFVTDPEQRSLPQVKFLQAALRLTSAEARLVRCLVQGLTLEQSAVHLGVAIGTLRTRLKVVFHKTNTNRQAELVKVAMATMSPG